MEGTRFQLRCAEEDADFVQLCTSYTLEGATQGELTLLHAGNEMQAKFKGVKVFLPPSREYVEVQLELLLGGHPSRRSCSNISILCAVDREYCQIVTAEQPQALA